MKWSKLLPLIGIAIFIYLVIKVGLSKIISMFSNASPIVWLAFPLIILALLLQLFRWTRILKKQKIDLPFLTNLKIQFIGLFYGFITPSRIGSLARAAYIKRYTGKSIPASSTSTVIERILDLLVLAIFASIGALFLLSQFSEILKYVLILFAIILLGAFIIIGKSRFKILYRILEIFIPKKLRPKSHKFIDAFYTTMLNPTELIVPFMISLIMWITVYTAAYVCAIALSLNVPWIQFMSFYAIANIVGAIPISLSGLGTREATLVLLFMQFGIPKDLMFSVGLLALLITAVLPAAVGGILALTDRK